MTALLLHIADTLREVIRILRDLLHDIDNELARRDSDRQQEVDSDDPG